MLFFVFVLRCETVDRFKLLTKKNEEVIFEILDKQNCATFLLGRVFRTLYSVNFLNCLVAFTDLLLETSLHVAVLCLKLLACLQHLSQLLLELLGHLFCLSQLSFEGLSLSLELSTITLSVLEQNLLVLDGVVRFV